MQGVEMDEAAEETMQGEKELVWRREEGGRG